MKKFSRINESVESTIPSETIRVFNWFDIQKEICKEMNIDHEYFRDYHKLIGGKYKDLWHEWMKYFQSGIQNDVILKNDMDESMESKLNWTKGDGKDWLEPFILAVYKVWDKYEIEYVKYSW